MPPIVPPLAAAFATLPDYRHARGKRHPLVALLLLACVAMLGGARAPLIVVTSKTAPARKIDTPFNHYNLLATFEAAYGVECLGHACDAKDALIEGLFD